MIRGKATNGHCPVAKHPQTEDYLTLRWRPDDAAGGNLVAANGAGDVRRFTGSVIETEMTRGGAAIFSRGLSILAKGVWDRYLSSGDVCGAALKQAGIESSFTARATTP